MPLLWDMVTSLCIGLSGTTTTPDSDGNDPHTILPQLTWRRSLHQSRTAHVNATEPRHGHGLDILVHSRRNAQAAKRFFRKLLRGLQYAPELPQARELGVCSGQFAIFSPNLTTPSAGFPV